MSAANGIKLSWFKPTQQWRKYRNGKQYYLDPKGINKSDRAAKREAWENWLAKLSELEAEEQYLAENPELRPSAAAFATDYKSLDYSPASAGTATLTSSSIADLLDTYLAVKRQETESGEISIQMYREHVDKLDDFRGFCQDVLNVKSVDKLTALGLDKYRQTQLHLLTVPKAKGGRSAATIKKRLTCVRQFVEWCFQLEAIPALPRNINRKYAKVTLPEPAPKSFSTAEIKKLLAKAEGQTRLYLLLGLNCGFNPTCISSLRHEHINWKTGEIDRPRHKTNGRQRHKLWKETLAALKQHATKRDNKQEGGGLVLLSAKGTELVQEKLRENSTTRTDTIGRQFTRLKDSLKMTGDNRGFKVLRSTSAENIKEIAGPAAASLFLAHTEKQTRRYYVTPDYAPLFKALTKLGSLYGIK